jgi:hypothetical protein
MRVHTPPCELHPLPTATLFLQPPSSYSHPLPTAAFEKTLRDHGLSAVRFPHPNSFVTLVSCHGHRGILIHTSLYRIHNRLQVLGFEHEDEVAGDVGYFS